MGPWWLTAVSSAWCSASSWQRRAATWPGSSGSSSSPISGIAILATILTSLILLGILGCRRPACGRSRAQAAIALALFTVSVVLATATVSNDNLQDLKTGYLVGATPWRQQVALIVGCVVGAAVIPPVLDLLYDAYGFAGALPRQGMDCGTGARGPPGDAHGSHRPRHFRRHAAMGVHRHRRGSPGWS